ncbi:MAG: Hpt domain-containing protein [Coriobacteriales bacterium]|jgi:HPt (histidine-containing phosphotransfer) domain-containing protein|nr:Hpt domain-containing protein [Coriobacteriales bacterium]
MTVDIDQILNANPIPGVDYTDGLKRFANNGSIYLRIVKSFVTNTPKTLDELAAVSPETLPEYAVQVHGLKGSCYGISATVIGDEARALEVAAKISDWAEVERDNPTLLEHAHELIEQLQRLLDTVAAAEHQGNGKPSAATPDPTLIHRLLNATLDFDADGMQKALDELDRFVYTSDPKAIDYLREQTTNFRYDLVEEKARELLS